MPSERYSTNELAKLLRRNKIATINELKEALGTSVDVTAFRKLRELDHHTSYSHRGRYYALEETTEFDEFGLWSFRSVWFSRYGTLLATAEACVLVSEAGYFATELSALLHVETQNALRTLVSQGRLAREKVAGKYLYCATDLTIGRRQLRSRKIYESEVSPGFVPAGPGIREIPDELQAAVVLFYSLLDEKQRRLYAGLESMKVGHGGDRMMADLLGIDPSTVARGRRDLLNRDVLLERVREAGGGRPRQEKKLRMSSDESES